MNNSDPLSSASYHKSASFWMLRMFTVSTFTLNCLLWSFYGNFCDKLPVPVHSEADMCMIFLFPVLCFLISHFQPEKLHILFVLGKRNADVTFEKNVLANYFCLGRWMPAIFGIRPWALPCASAVCVQAASEELYVLFCFWLHQLFILWLWFCSGTFRNHWVALMFPFKIYEAAIHLGF